MTRKERDELAYLKREISNAKSELIRIERRIAQISPRQAEKLGSIIGRLEDFQNR